MSNRKYTYLIVSEPGPLASHLRQVAELISTMKAKGYEPCNMRAKGRRGASDNRMFFRRPLEQQLEFAF